ncbi:hypothetical protein [Vreelandella alkaliphila]|uniref:Alpha/beta hydrolase n=1 Tax=Vreelandella alkaliphila TaxID=272774 RepID=A0ABX4HKG4_9GAMM|nr:hypothetical protein [Halomonas humidisoli]PAU72999.1 hypothetical protein CK497_07760 [Halomonas humidisoli]
MLSTQQEIVFNEDFSITRHLPNKIKSDVIVISFDTITGGLSRKGFATDFLINNGIESFFVSHRRHSFYQGLSQSTFRDIMLDHLYGKEVFTYGSSLGGYAAIYYASSINAQPIALAPQCSIDPIHKETPYSKYKEVFTHEVLCEKSNKTLKIPIIAYDPLFIKDKCFIDERVKKAYPESVFLEVANGGHSIAETLKNSHVLKKFFFYSISGFVDSLRKLDVDAEKNPYYAGKLAGEAWHNKNYSESNRLLKKAFIYGGNKQCLGVYNLLVERRVANFKLDQEDISGAVRDSVIRQFSLKESEGASYYNQLLNLYKMHDYLIDYRSALDVVKFMRFSFPTDKNIVDLLNYAEKKFLFWSGISLNRY